jgi:hypothetical protein
VQAAGKGRLAGRALLGNQSAQAAVSSIDRMAKAAANR